MKVAVVIIDDSLVRMAIKFESKNPPRCESVRKGLVDLFPDFDVELDQSDKRKYLKKAKSLVCPVNGVLLDPHPLVFGESKGDLLKRIQFGSGKKMRAKRTVPAVKVDESTLLTGSDYLSFVRSTAFLENACDFPYTVEIMWNRYYDGMNRATMKANDGILQAENTSERMPTYIAISSAYTWS